MSQPSYGPSSLRILNTALDLYKTPFPSLTDPGDNHVLDFQY